ncbi:MULTISPECIES: hypothetical protein [unclassified Psychrobacter]|uniref:hypothetical protein n=1 Tax=unclassified Psychrobacter TaxID=196806 RepID=UPI001D18DAC5|nr:MULTISPECIES: hypothetical protein [unclassified Psychrobacter]
MQKKAIEIGVVMYENAQMAAVLCLTDLGLRMVDRFLGSEVMNATARTLLIDP